jgi:hypothetical protein
MMTSESVKELPQPEQYQAQPGSEGSGNVNPSDPAPLQRFFCSVQDKAEGPFDLIELAAELKYAHINADTPICREGKEDWVAFRDLPEFVSAQEMSIETIARHLVEKARIQRSSRSPRKIPPLFWILAVATYFSGVVVLVVITTPVPPAPKTSKPQIPVRVPWLKAGQANLGSLAATP